MSQRVYSYREKDWLEEKYVEDRWSQTEIAEYCGVTQSTIYKWMKKHGIEARSVSDANKGESNGAWKESPVKDYDWLYRMYVQEEKTLREIAEVGSVALRTVARWMERHDIERRNDGEQFSDCSGEKNSNWKGGAPTCQECGRERSRSSQARCWDCHAKRLESDPQTNSNYSGQLDFTKSLRSYTKEEWRPKVFERDGYTCQECGDDSGGNLQAHHIVPFTALRDQILMENAAELDLDTEEGRSELLNRAKNDTRINDIDNGVTLCEDCHKAEHRRLKVEQEHGIYRYFSDVLEVIDGDSLRLEIDLGFQMTLRETVRLYGVDSPELNSADIHRREKAIDVTNVVEHICTPGRRIRIRTYKSGKYGRWLAMVLLTGSSLNKYLVDTGLAEEYFL